MSTTASRRGAPVEALSPARARAAAAAAPRDPVRRRWGRIGAGVAAALLGAWVFAALYLSADDTREVLVVAEGVERLESIERSDLRVVSLPTNSDVQTVPASRLNDLVGRIAATDLAAGSLLADGQLVPVGERLVAADEAVVGVLVGPGDAPATGLDRGAAVSVVVRPPAGVTGDAQEVPGWVADVSGAVASNGDRPVEVVVAKGDAAAVSAAAADRRVTIVVLGE